MDIGTAKYIIHFFPRLLNDDERAAMRHSNSLFKLLQTEDLISNSEYNAKIKWLEEKNQFTNDSNATRLLNDGNEQFHINTATRIVNESSEKVFYNYCPDCKQLARTPYSRQCKHCGKTWHDTIAATFKLDKIISINSRPDILYFAGLLKSGIVKTGMKIDLTFLGVSIKPIIEGIDFADNISEQKSHVVISAKIESADDIDYLISTSLPAIPIVIQIE